MGHLWRAHACPQRWGISVGGIVKQRPQHAESCDSHVRRRVSGAALRTFDPRHVSVADMCAQPCANRRDHDRDAQQLCSPPRCSPPQDGCGVKHGCCCPLVTTIHSFRSTACGYLCLLCPPPQLACLMSLCGRHLSKHILHPPNDTSLHWSCPKNATRLLVPDVLSLSCSCAAPPSPHVQRAVFHRTWDSPGAGTAVVTRSSFHTAHGFIAHQQVLRALRS